METHKIKKIIGTSNIIDIDYLLKGRRVMGVGNGCRRAKRKHRVYFNKKLEKFFPREKDKGLRDYFVQNYENNLRSYAKSNIEKFLNVIEIISKERSMRLKIGIAQVINNLKKYK